ncbi:MAG: hypothetical protein AMXMBFR13_38710 [Phycisphaerae bacterium]
MNRAPLAVAGAVLAAMIAIAGLLVHGAGTAPPTPAAGLVQAAGALTPRNFAVLAYNDLGMHCMGQDNSDLMILPPYNTLRAQVVDRSGEEPEIMDSDVTVKYTIPGNTHSADKDNFWTYAPALLGVTLPPDVGLTGNGMAGTMVPTGENDWIASGIPITPIDDTGRENPYPLALVMVLQNGTEVARTQAVVPVSWEMNCQLCHTTPGLSVAADILARHDQLHGTNLQNQKPVLCAGCHADNALGLPGQPGIPNLSAAMHGAHADRMQAISLDNDCYACHPGLRTKCLRDVHFNKGYTCTYCHGLMAALGDQQRRPWLDQPSCGGCHARPGFEYEEPGKLYRESRGHMGIHCEACHGSPHAITPTVMEVDNLQAILVQGHAGVINNCTVCHRETPDDAFPHRRSDD